MFVGVWFVFGAAVRIVTALLYLPMPPFGEPRGLAFWAGQALTVLLMAAAGVASFRVGRQRLTRLAAEPDALERTVRNLRRGPMLAGARGGRAPGRDHGDRHAMDPLHIEHTIRP